MTLRTRLILSYILIVIICLGITAVLVSVLLQGYRNQLALTRLDDMTRPITVQIKSLIRGQTTAAELWSSSQEQSQNNNLFYHICG